MDSITNKKYVIITPSISNLGGAQLYVLRRAKNLVENGYCVKLIISHHNSSNFILENQFSEIPILHLHELQKPVSFFSKRKIESLICKIRIFLKDFKNGMVESSSLETSVWGELISGKLHLKHIIYFLAEPRAFAFYYYPGYAFFLHKYDRGELFGTTPFSLSLILGKKIEQNKNRFINVPFDPSELAEQSAPAIGIADVDEKSFVIGTIARLEKSYIKPFIESCIRLAQKHPDRKFTVIIAGGSENLEILEKLKKMYAYQSLCVQNLCVFFTGYIKLLGKDFFKTLNVFVGQGTASINAISQRCATLNIDPNNDDCSGIFGIDVDNFAYSQNNKTYKIEDKLEALMLDKTLLEFAKVKGYELFQQKYSVDVCFNNMDILINSSSKEDKYYPFDISMRTKVKDRLRMIEGTIKTAIYKSILLLMKKKPKRGHLLRFSRPKTGISK